MDKHQLENLFDELFPLNRSISGDGLHKTLEIISREIPLDIIEYPTGMECFDWKIPDEWNIREAYIKRTNGDKVVDFKDNNLHIMGYSMPVEGRFAISELKKHLYCIENKPEAIPFVTSYYKRRWGFCLPYSVFTEMTDPEYDVLIDSSLRPGSVSAGECFIKGKTDKELLLFSHIGHPSMANDQLSGPITLTAVAKWLLENKDKLKYSYRVLLAPETIGSIAYIFSNINRLKDKCIGGYTAVCTADNASYTYRTSRSGNAVSDRAMEDALRHSGVNYTIKDFSPLGCDERHFNSHGIGIPIGSIMRSEPGTYPEYHTSLDNKAFVSFEKMHASVELIIDSIRNIEVEARLTAVHLNCEPKLDKYGLYPTLSNKNDSSKVARQLISIWAFSDGSLLSEIAEKLNMPVLEVRKFAELLAEHNIIRIDDF
jgi:aminopeptidase-like protein